MWAVVYAELTQSACIRCGGGSKDKRPCSTQQERSSTVADCSAQGMQDQGASV